MGREAAKLASLLTYRTLWFYSFGSASCFLLQCPAPSLTRRRIRPIEKNHDALRELEALNRLAIIVSSTTDVDEIIDAIVKESTELTQAQQGSILLTKDEEASKFTTLVRQGANANEDLVRKMCMVVAGWVLKNQQPVLVNDISADERFQGLQVLGYPLKAILAVPIQTAGNTLTGPLPPI
ncbi:GAF domain-containing protein, partial [bacterium]|nr:GAF domain-containing protein [bacterium]